MKQVVDLSQNWRTDNTPPVPSTQMYRFASFLCMQLLTEYGYAFNRLYKEGKENDLHLMPYLGNTGVLCVTVQPLINVHTHFN